MDLRKHSAEIHRLVDEANARDKNWSWTIELLLSDKILLKWSYLAHLDEYCQCFIISYNGGDTYCGYTMYAPSGELISVADSVSEAIREVCYYATSRY